MSSDPQWGDVLAALQTALIAKVSEEGAALLVRGIDALVASIEGEPLGDQVVRYAFKLANGVTHENPTMSLALQRELVVDGIANLYRDLQATPADVRGLSVQALATLALAAAGFP